MTAVSDPARFGAYEVDHLVGSGGFADVYLCYHAGLQTRVAVKVLHPHLARDEAICEKFLVEAQVLWRADSDRVIQVTHVDQLDDGRPYFVMRYADQGSLADFIAERATEFGELLSLRQTVGLGLELIDCLHALRSRDLVHRDIKPHNILLKTIRTPDHERAERFDLPAGERLLLADFGLAKRLEDGTNMASQLGGTPAYMAPELASLYGDVSWRADQFAVAVIIYEIATGAVPWPMRDLGTVADVDLGLVSVNEWRPEFPKALDGVLHRALAPDAHDRFDDPDAFAEALLDLLGESAPTTATSDPRLAIHRACDVARGLPEIDADGVAAAAVELDRPVRVGIIGGNRLSPTPLGLKLVGERVPPGEGSLFGSVVVRMMHGELAATATLAGGEQVDGTLSKDESGYLHVQLAAPAWMVETVSLRLPHAEFDDIEVIDVPHAVLRRNRELVEQMYASFDVVAVGIPGELDAELAAVDEVLRLGAAGTGPFAALGVRQIGTAGGSRHPALLATVPADDTMELRITLDEILSGGRRDDVRASAGYLALSALVSDADSPVRTTLAAAVDESPALAEVSLLRRDLASSDLEPATRRRLHRLLGRRIASARLGAVPDAPVELLLSSLSDERRAWETDARVPAEVLAIVDTALARLETSLHERMTGGVR